MLTVYVYTLQMTTTMGLLELAHPSQPLLRRLPTETPGTYHLSAIAPNLPGRAADDMNVGRGAARRMLV